MSHLSTPSRRHVLAVLTAGASMLAPLATAAPAGATSQISAAWIGDDSSTTPLRLTFDTPQQASGPVVNEVVNSGSADLAAEIVTEGGGEWRSVDRHGQSVETPGFSATDDAPQAILGLTPADGDPLAPGYSSFQFGADFRLDAVSDGGARDNGDNLVQRGLAGDVAQYKLQVDSHRPACRIKGSAGAVKVVSATTVPSYTWIRVSCRRYTERVELTVTDMESGNDTTTTAYGVTGDVRPDSSNVPLSVGGKLNAVGGIVSSSDQFNGVIDEVLLQVF